MQTVVLLGWIVLLAFFFAKVEIHVEGEGGWAENLPTWRIRNHPLLKYLFWGRDLTGYHVWMLGFMALVFHLPVFVHGEFSMQIELRILGSLALFWVFEDFLWFVMNPAYGVRRFNSREVSWHKHWVMGVPVDYLVFGVLGITAICLGGK